MPKYGRDTHGRIPNTRLLSKISDKGLIQRTDGKMLLIMGCGQLGSALALLCGGRRHMSQA